MRPEYWPHPSRRRLSFFTPFATASPSLGLLGCTRLLRMRVGKASCYGKIKSAPATSIAASDDNASDQ